MSARLELHAMVEDGLLISQPSCAKKLGVSCRVKVPAWSGLTSHPYRVLPCARTGAVVEEAKAERYS